MGTSAIMLISSSDQQGVVAAITDFLKRHSGNIINLEQYVDKKAAMFFMRVEWELEPFDLRCAEINAKFGAIADRYSIKYTLRFPDYKPRMALMVSKLSHGFYDLLARYMQVLSDDFVSEYPNWVINIYHSFLPAFAGVRPHHPCARCEDHWCNQPLCDGGFG